MFKEIFHHTKPIIGMIHGFDGDSVIQRRQALEDLEALQDYVDGVIVENYGWGYKNSNEARPETVHSMESLTSYVVSKSRVPVGVNVLPNDYEGAFSIAYRTGARFVQLDHVTGRFVEAESVDSSSLLKTRAKYDGIDLLGGVHPKYYDLEDENEPIEDAAKAALPLCDAIVATGEYTGGETDLEDLRRVRSAVGDHPIVVGSGLNPQNAYRQLKIADGAIVGSAFKRRGVVPGEGIDRKLVLELMKEVERARGVL